MYKYPYKEKDYAEVILKNGFTSNYISHELKLIAKYHKKDGKSLEEIKELLHTFCGKRFKKYSRVTHFNMVNNIVNYVSKEENVLVQIDEMAVSKEELKFIDDFEIDYKLKKLLFTLLILNKLGKRYSLIRSGEASDSNYFGGGGKYRELSSSSHIKFRKGQNIHHLIGELADHGLVKICNKGYIELSFINTIKKDNEIEFVVKDFQRIGLYLDLHTGQEKVKVCEECEAPIKIKSNKTKYCADCAKIIKNEQRRVADLKYKRKIRAVDKIEKR